MHKAQILQFLINIVQAEAIGDRSVYFQRLACNTLNFFARH